MKVGDEIKLGTVEGETSKRGKKQNQIFTITKLSSVKNYYEAINEAGDKFSIHDLNGDMSRLGISKVGSYRMTYTESFELITL